MARIRIFTAVLAMLSALVAAWAWASEDAPEAVLVTLVVAAACLAAVSPFDAPDPPRRTRVAVACLVYVAAVGAAIVAARADASGLLIGVLFLLAELGLGLAGWAFATRRRRRIAASRRYYDN